MQQKKFVVHGMHCASCSNIISKKIKKLPGIVDCNVNFATEKAEISFDDTKVTLDKMNDEIEKLGYHLSYENDLDVINQKETHISEDHASHLGISHTKEQKLEELQKLKSKIDISLPITFFVFLLMIWNILARIYSPLIYFPFPMRLIDPVLFIVSSYFIFVIGHDYLTAVVRFIKFKVANMDTLVGIGTLTAYLYSSIHILFPDLHFLLKLPEDTYFDVTIVVIGFVTLGKYLESRSKIKTGSAIEKLLGLQAKNAHVVRNGKEFDIAIEKVIEGDLIHVKPGEKIPVDGIITQGSTSIDESMISGESLPVDKSVGSHVIGSTINKQGSIYFKTTKVGTGTMLAQIIQMVEKAQGSKTEIQNLADKISSIFIPIVIGIAIFSFIAWITIGSYFLGFSEAVTFAILSFVGVLVIACPCALGLATPTAIIVGVGKGAENGILIKNAQSLENLKKIDTIVFDKTGTLTIGTPIVTDIVTLNNYKENVLLTIAASIEKNSQHPLAQAIVKKGIEENLHFKVVKNFTEEEGSGVKGEIDGENISITKPQNDYTNHELLKLQKQGKTVVVLSINGKKEGLFAISDSIKKESKNVIDKLHKLGLSTIMLTGDNKATGEYIAQQIGIDIVKAEVLPQDKSIIIKELQNEGKKVAMLGDGINDAPALTQAHVGIAMATGSDIAIESSDITLLGGDLSKLLKAIKLSRATITTVKQNLFWAFVYNIIGIPLAAGAFYPLFGIFLNPIFAGLAMGLSSVSVVSNSLLLKTKKL